MTFTGCKKQPDENFYIPREPDKKLNISKTKKFHNYRIIDHLSNTHVEETPFKDLLKDFRLVEEEVTGRWKYIPELSTSSQEIWAVTTKHQILGDQVKEKPVGIKLFKNGKEVEFSSLLHRGGEKWNWYHSSENLNLKAFDSFDKKYQGIIIKQGDSFQFEKFFPEDDVIIDFYIVNPDWKQFTPCLEIMFNQEKVEELKVTRMKWYRIRKKVSMGPYKVKIKFDESELKEKDRKKKLVIIGMIRITTSSDVLLFSQPRKRKGGSPEGKFLFHYHTPDLISPTKDKTDLRKKLYLWRIKDKYPLHDFGIGRNPHGLKRKITTGEYSYNVILAPPKTKFTIPLEIPQKACLEFSYGMLDAFKNKSSKQRIRFRVILKRLKEKKTLLDQSLKGDDQKRFIPTEFDLSPYAGKKIELSFITEKDSLEKNEDNLPPVIPVWVNPLVSRYEKKEGINIILISLDTLRPDHLSCYGYERDTSPYTDKVAQDGVLFKNTFSTSSWTLPAHVSLLTSLNCARHQVYYPDQKMGNDFLTLADLLRVNQFYCATFTGGGYLSERYGFSKGFDKYYEVRLYGDKSIRYDEAERLSELATDWIEKNQRKKFFLFLHTYQPHDPYSNPSPWGKEFLSKNHKWKQIKLGSLFENSDSNRFDYQFSEREKQNIVDLYDGEIKYTDQVFIAPIIQKLKKLNLYEKSFIIITSDHGEEFYDHEAWLHDHSLYNEGIKIPLIIKFPHGLYKGRKVEKFVRITDILPTILDQVDIQYNSGYFDGKTVLPLLKNNHEEEKQKVFISDLALRGFTTPPDLISVNYGHLKLILNKRVVSPYVKKTSHRLKDLYIELYDLEKDPQESSNLFENNSYRDICFQLIKKINEYYKQVKLEKGEEKKVEMDEALKKRLKSLGYIR